MHVHDFACKTRFELQLAWRIIWTSFTNQDESYGVAVSYGNCRLNYACREKSVAVALVGERHTQRSASVYRYL